MTNDPTPAVKRGAEANYGRHHQHVQALHGGADIRLRELPQWVQECWEENTFAALDAALDVDDDDAVEAMARAIWPELYDGTTEQSLSDAGLTTLAANRRAAFLRQDLMQYARAGYRAIRTSILGGDS